MSLVTNSGNDMWSKFQALVSPSRMMSPPANDGGGAALSACLPWSTEGAVAAVISGTANFGFGSPDAVDILVGKGLVDLNIARMDQGLRLQLTQVGQVGTQVTSMLPAAQQAGQDTPSTNSGPLGTALIWGSDQLRHLVGATGSTRDQMTRLSQDLQGSLADLNQLLQTQVQGAAKVSSGVLRAAQSGKFAASNQLMVGKRIADTIVGTAASLGVVQTIREAGGQIEQDPPAQSTSQHSSGDEGKDQSAYIYPSYSSPGGGDVSAGGQRAYAGLTQLRNWVGDDSYNLSMAVTSEGTVGENYQKLRTSYAARANAP